MEYPVRVYGYNIIEEHLAQLFINVSWHCLIFLIIASIFNKFFIQTQSDSEYLLSPCSLAFMVVPIETKKIMAHRHGS